MKTFTIFLLLSVSGIAGLQAQSRLTGYSYYYYSTKFNFSDSEVYTYTGSRGGDLTHTLDYDAETGLVYDNYAQAFIDNTLWQQTFDSHNNITSQLFQTFDTLAFDWVNKTETYNYYDANNNDTFSLNQVSGGGNKWAIANAIHNTYSGKNLTNEVIQNFDVGQQKYVNSAQLLMTYNSGNQILTSTNQYWSTLLSTWVNNSMTTWYYDASGNDTAQITQLYDTTAKQWVNNEKIVNDFNGNNTVNTSFELTWNKIGGVWDSTQRTLYYYDANKNDTSMIQQFKSLNTWQDFVKSVYKYNSYHQATYYENLTSFGLFVPNFEYFYYYENYTGIDEPGSTNLQIQLYPNPSSNIVTVSATLPKDEPVQLSLYNSLGQQGWSLDMGKAKRIECMVPVNNLANGVYILKVIQGSGVGSKQVVVNR